MANGPTGRLYRTVFVEEATGLEWRRDGHRNQGPGLQRRRLPCPGRGQESAASRGCSIRMAIPCRVAMSTIRARIRRCRSRRAWSNSFVRQPSSRHASPVISTMSGSIFWSPTSDCSPVKSPSIPGAAMPVWSNPAIMADIERHVAARSNRITCGGGTRARPALRRCAAREMHGGRWRFAPGPSCRGSASGNAADLDHDPNPRVGIML